VLAEHLASHACSVAFPELAHVPLAALRRFAKACPVDRFRRAARQLADAVGRNVAWVGAARDRVDFSPKDLERAAVREFFT
jgi:nucleolar complex protein 2